MFSLRKPLTSETASWQDRLFWVRIRRSEWFLASLVFAAMFTVGCMILPALTSMLTTCTGQFRLWHGGYETVHQGTF